MLGAEALQQVAPGNLHEAACESSDGNDSRMFPKWEHQGSSLNRTGAPRGPRLEAIRTGTNRRTGRLALGMSPTGGESTHHVARRPCDECLDVVDQLIGERLLCCLLYTSPSPRDRQ